MQLLINQERGNIICS